MFATLSPARRRLVTTLLAAVLVLVLAGAATLVVKAFSGGTAAAQDDPGPVVLVPGYGGNTSDLDPLVARAKQQGRQAVVFTPTNGGTGDLAAQAKRLAALVDRTLKSTGAASVDLVGYSAGGVISRLYVRDDDGASVVRRVLTIGSPQHGTDLATIAQDAVGSCPKACEQLATDSDLIRGLNAGDETPKGPLWFTVRSSSDRTVVPTDTAELSGARNTLVQTACPAARTSHGDLPGDPVTLQLFDAVIAKAVPGTLRLSC